MKKIIAALLFALTTFGFAFAIECVDSSKVNFIFTDKENGSELLNTQDEFTDALSDFDMSARLKTSKKVSKAEYLDFISKQSLDWTKDEKKSMDAAITEIKKLMKKYKIILPKDIYLVKTTGKEEGDSAYCRGQNVIVFSQNMITLNDLNEKKDLLIHELFHIYSKNNLDVREKLYNSIGFYKTKELTMTPIMSQYKVTNPDAVHNNYYFYSTVEGEKEKVLPFLMAASDYDESLGGEFFDYMILVFCPLVEGEESNQVITINGQECFYSYKDVPDYFELIGENTDYIIHPEEVLADNFVLLITNSKNVKTKKIISDMKKILKK